MAANTVIFLVHLAIWRHDGFFGAASDVASSGPQLSQCTTGAKVSFGTTSFQSSGMYEWPSFASAAELQVSPWGAYFTSVYGELPTTYPVQTLDLWMLDDSLLKTAGVDVPPSVGSCPTSEGIEGERYACNSMYQAPGTSWIWHPGPFRELSGWVEVWHVWAPFETHGAWFLYTPGSGIFFDLGKTISFQEHSEARRHWNVPGIDQWPDAYFPAAAADGYDSIQFLAHLDSQWPCSVQRPGAKFAQWHQMGVEIVATRLAGKYACTAEGGAPAVIRAGWKASRPCKCSNTHYWPVWPIKAPRTYLNCQSSSSLQDASDADAAVQV